jgi:chromosome segregation ATPase
MSDEDGIGRAKTMAFSPTAIAIEQVRQDVVSLRNELDGVSAQVLGVDERVEKLERRFAHTEVRLGSLYEDERTDSKNLKAIADAIGASPDDATGTGGAGMRRQIASLVRESQEHEARIRRTLTGIEAAAKLIAACVAVVTAVVAAAVAFRGCS